MSFAELPDILVVYAEGKDSMSVGERCYKRSYLQNFLSATLVVYGTRHTRQFLHRQTKFASPRLPLILTFS
jgi:hypothetical protein